MDDNERQAIEVAQTLVHVHDIADLLAQGKRHLPEAEAELLLDQELVRLAVLAKGLEARSDVPGLASGVGYKITAVIRSRVASLLRSR